MDLYSKFLHYPQPAENDFLFLYFSCQCRIFKNDFNLIFALWHAWLDFSVLVKRRVEDAITTLKQIRDQDSVRNLYHSLI
jgi:hypothetical protein